MDKIKEEVGRTLGIAVAPLQPWIGRIKENEGGMRERLATRSVEGSRLGDLVETR